MRIRGTDKMKLINLDRIYRIKLAIFLASGVAERIQKIQGAILWKTGN